MSVTIVFDYCQSIENPIILEYFYRGDKIDDPSLFFDLTPGLFEEAFPSPEETQVMIDKYALFGATHKLVVSELGFNLVFL